MQQHMFTPLYPRCVTSSTALILSICLLISSITHFAYATNANTIVQEDHNHPRILDLREHQDGLWPLESAREERSQTYEPMFAGLDRSILGRAPPEPRKLVKEIPAQGSLDIEDGEPQSWTLAFPLDTRNLDKTSTRNGDEEHEQHEFLKRQEGQGSVRLYITLCVCDQPSRKTPSASGDAPPALRVNISESQNSNKNSTIAESGLGILEYDTSSEAYITVEADTNPDFKGVYNYSLTASVIGPNASYNGSDSDNLNFLDSDNNSALLVSQNFTGGNNSSSPEWQQWMNNTPPYSIFVYSQDDPAIMGIQKSVCGLRSHAQIMGRWLNDEGTLNDEGKAKVQLSMTNSSGGQPKQHFYVNGLNASTNYSAIMAYDGSSTENIRGAVGRGPTVWKPVSFSTKTDNNCAVIFNLPFCTDTAYAVPFNPTNTTWKANLTTLALLYDQQASTFYQNFSFSLQQIPCETTSSAQYSLARNCSDCDAAYKSWLCAVTIPRCHDYSAPDLWLQERSVNQSFSSQSNSPLRANHTVQFDPNNNSSRTDLIQNTIKPGPWKEVLPCKDLCYNLVQSCPAALNFNCPVGKWLNWSYGHKEDGPNVTCNDPTIPWGTNGAGMARVGMNFLGALLALTIVLVLN